MYCKLLISLLIVEFNQVCLLLCLHPGAILMMAIILILMICFAVSREGVHIKAWSDSIRLFSCQRQYSCSELSFFTFLYIFKILCITLVQLFLLGSNNSVSLCTHEWYTSPFSLFKTSKRQLFGKLRFWYSNKVHKNTV